MAHRFTINQPSVHINQPMPTHIIITLISCWVVGKSCDYQALLCDGEPVVQVASLRAQLSEAKAASAPLRTACVGMLGFVVKIGDGWGSMGDDAI